jgi:hypothetical protein
MRKSLNMQAVKAASRARAAAEAALRMTCIATQSAFVELQHEVAGWRSAPEKPSHKVHTDTLPLVYPGPLTHLVALKTTVVLELAGDARSPRSPTESTSVLTAS